MMDVERLDAQEIEGEFVVTLDYRPDFLTHFTKMDGCGETLADAFRDLADQLENTQ
jgi:hypothetical protein